MNDLKQQMKSTQSSLDGNNAGKPLKERFAQFAELMKNYAGLHDFVNRGSQDA